MPLVYTYKIMKRVYLGSDPINKEFKVYRTPYYKNTLLQVCLSLKTLIKYTGLKTAITIELQ